MTRQPTRALARRSALGLSLLLIVSALALPAVAEDATTDRSYVAALDPGEVCNGVEEALTLTLTNTSSQQRLGSARIDVPGAVALSTDDLEVTVSQQRGPKTDPIVAYDADAGVISLDDLSAAPGADVILTFTATATATATGDNSTSVEFTTQAKQANDFNSTSEPANELVLVGDQPTTTIVSCGTLAFLVQPGDTSVDVAIPGADGTGSPQVAVVDDQGSVITGASATITVTRTDAADSLGGGTTQATQSGVATFDDLTTTPADVYTLTASADGYSDVESETFEVFAFGDICLEGDQCTTILNDDRDSTTSLSGTAVGGTGALIGSTTTNGDEACGAVDAEGNPVDYDVADYSYLPNQVTIGATNLENKLVEFAISKQYDQKQANNGVSFYQVCAEPLAPFTEFSTFVDIFGNRVVNPDDVENLELLELDADDVGTTFQTSGFLPDCASADDTPCVESRVKRNGGPLLTVRWGSRWAMR